MSVEDIEKNIECIRIDIKLQSDYLPTLINWYSQQVVLEENILFDALKKKRIDSEHPARHHSKTD